MPRLSRRVSVGAITILAMGAGATPALAAGPTPLVRAIEKLQPHTQLSVDVSLRTPAEERSAIRLLVTNAAAREQAANLVAEIPAISSQQAAKAEWLSGIRDGVREDIQAADAVFAVLSGDKAFGRRELNSQALINEQFRVNKLTSRADLALGIR